MVDKTLKWPLVHGNPLPTWISPSFKVIILGDAAHAMLPYMAQGAAMAVEDGAALAVVLNAIEGDGTVEAYKSNARREQAKFNTFAFLRRPGTGS
jgi:salicylate hydroxylase